MPKPKKVIADSGDEFEDDGFMADTQIAAAPKTISAGPVIFSGKTGSAEAAQLAR